MSPRWRGTLLYVPVLYGLGWLLVRPLAGLAPGLRPDQVDLAGAGVSLVLLLLSLPLRLRRAWGESRPWSALGVAAPPGASLRAFGRGLLKALGLLALVVAALLAGGGARWIGPAGLDGGEGLNALAAAATGRRPLAAVLVAVLGPRHGPGQLQRRGRALGGHDLAELRADGGRQLRAQRHQQLPQLGGAPRLWPPAVTLLILLAVLLPLLLFSLLLLLSAEGPGPVQQARRAQLVLQDARQDDRRLQGASGAPNNPGDGRRRG